MNAVVKQPTNAVVMHKEPASYDLVEVRSNPTRFPRIGTTPQGTAQIFMREVVITALMIKGLSLDNSAVDFIAANLLSEVMADDHRLGLRELSWYEAGRAVRKAATSGDMYGVSVATIFEAFVDYARGEGHEADLIYQTRKKAERAEARKEVDAFIDKAAAEMYRRAKV